MLPLPSVSCKWKKGSNFLAKEGMRSQSEASSQPAWSCILNNSLRYPLRNDLPDTKVSSRKIMTRLVGSNMNVLAFEKAKNLYFELIFQYATHYTAIVPSSL